LFHCRFEVFKSIAGQALEWAWATRSGRPRQFHGATTSRLAIVLRGCFNATIVDTGEPLLIGTTRVGGTTTPD
jgi:hypothetical protein